MNKYSTQKIKFEEFKKKFSVLLENSKEENKPKNIGENTIKNENTNRSENN